MLVTCGAAGGSPAPSTSKVRHTADAGPPADADALQTPAPLQTQTPELLQVQTPCLAFVGKYKHEYIEYETSFIFIF